MHQSEKLFALEQPLEEPVRYIKELVLLPEHRTFIIPTAILYGRYIKRKVSSRRYPLDIKIAHGCRILSPRS